MLILEWFWGSKDEVDYWCRSNQFSQSSLTASGCQKNFIMVSESSLNFKDESDSWFELSQPGFGSVSEISPSLDFDEFTWELKPD